MDEVSVASRRSRSTKTLAATNNKKSRGSSKTTSAKPTPPAAAVVAPTNSHKGSNSKNTNNNTNNHVGQGMYFVKQQGKIRYESKYADLSFLSALLVSRFDKTRCRQELIPISTDLNEDLIWCPLIRVCIRTWCFSCDLLLFTSLLLHALLADCSGTACTKGSMSTTCWSS